MSPGPGSRLQCDRRRRSARRLCRTAGRPAAGLAGGRQRARTAIGRRRSPQRARPDAGHFGRGAGRTAACCWPPNNDRSFTRAVRRQRAGIVAAMAAVILLSVLLSMFPGADHRPAFAAARARGAPGSAGPIARSAACLACRRAMTRSGFSLAPSSDMSQSLRQRIDNMEAFAADVTHELKNPLASLRSAVDGLDRVDDPALRQRADGHRTRGRRTARSADQRYQRSGPDRRRACPGNVRPRRPRSADRAARRKLGDTPRDRRCAHRLRPAAQGHRSRHGQAGSAGARDQQHHRQCG